MGHSAPAFACDAARAEALMSHGDGSVWQNVNRAPFLFGHGLAHAPLFDIPRLARLAEQVIDKDGGRGYSSNSDQKLSLSELKRRQIDDIYSLHEGQHWLKLASVNLVDREYDDLLQTLLKEMEALTDIPVRKLTSWAGLTVFMNSPHLEVPYHFDHDTNFLMQIQGEKDVYLFDPHDRWILTEQEIEDFYRGNSLAGRYREELKPTRTCYHLSPGLAVHHPPLAPHMITNGSEVSISVAFFFTSPAQDALARIYQSNHLLRKLGLQPKAPGQSALSDWLKSGLIKACSKSRPANYSEFLYSGVNRITSPTRLIKRIAGRLAAPH